jgi:hypothetical protein
MRIRNMRSAICRVASSRSGFFAMRYQLSISDEIVRAIGLVSAHWAVLEYYVARTTIACLTKYGNPGSRGAERTAFMERRQAFFDSFEWDNVDSETQERGIALADRIETVENKRHIIIHGMAEQLADQYDVQFTRAGPEKHWFNEHFTERQILDIADEIADINGDLAVLYIDLWLSSAIAP